jgi:hypothetical protein
MLTGIPVAPSSGVTAEENSSCGGFSKAFGLTKNKVYKLFQIAGLIGMVELKTRNEYFADTLFRFADHVINHVTFCQGMSKIAEVMQTMSKVSESEKPKNTGALITFEDIKKFYQDMKTIKNQKRLQFKM